MCVDVHCVTVYFVDNLRIKEIGKVTETIMFYSGFQLELCLIKQRWASLYSLIRDQEQTLWIAPSP